MKNWTSLKLRAWVYWVHYLENEKQTTVWKIIHMTKDSSRIFKEFLQIKFEGKTTEYNRQMGKKNLK